MSLADVGASAASRVGRYFDASTFLPTVLVVSYVYVLSASDAWSGTPQWSAALDRLTTLAGAAAVGILSLALSRWPFIRSSSA